METIIIKDKTYQVVNNELVEIKVENKPEPTPDLEEARKVFAEWGI